MDEKAEAESVHGLTYSATYTVLSEYPSTAESRPEEVLIRPLVPEEEKTVAVSPKKREIPQQPAASDPPPLTGFPFYRPSDVRTNRQLLLNACERFVFRAPGTGAQKASCLSVLTTTSATHFLFLFRNAEGCHYRGLYAYESDTSQLKKLSGAGPSFIKNESRIDKFLKYNSAQKYFTVVPTNHLSITIDAFTLENAYWLNGKKNLSQLSSAGSSQTNSSRRRP